MDRASITQIIKFAMAAGFVILLALSALFVEDLAIRGASFAFILFLAGPVLILVWRDTGQIFRRLGEASKPYRFLGRVFGYPQAAFGGICLLVGLAVVPLLLYRWLMEGESPEGPWIRAPLGFVVFGLIFMRDAFKAAQVKVTEGNNAQ